MFGTYDNIKVCGVSAASPICIENSIDAIKYLGERRCKKQMRLTGVESRRVSLPEQTISDLGYSACKRLLEDLQWKSDSISVLILGTQCPNYVTPSTAFLIQKLLGISDDALVFDYNLGCSSFNVGLQLCSSLLQTCPVGSRALCVMGDLAYSCLSSDDGQLDPDALAGALLFGSAAGALAIEKTEHGNTIPFMSKSDGTRYEAIITRKNGRLSMLGQDVFNFAINDVVKDVTDFKRMAAICDDDIDYYVFHQAQKLILDNIVLELNIDQSKELRSIHDFGNTSGASIPISICANRERLKKEKTNFFTCGFGVGLSWSMACFNVETKHILPVTYTDDVFES